MDHNRSTDPPAGRNPPRPLLHPSPRRPLLQPSPGSYSTRCRDRQAGRTPEYRSQKNWVDARLQTELPLPPKPDVDENSDEYRTWERQRNWFKYERAKRRKALTAEWEQLQHESPMEQDGNVDPQAALAAQSADAVGMFSGAVGMETIAEGLPFTPGDFSHASGRSSPTNSGRSSSACASPANSGRSSPADFRTAPVAGSPFGTPRAVTPSYPGTPMGTQMFQFHTLGAESPAQTLKTQYMVQSLMSVAALRVNTRAALQEQEAQQLSDSVTRANQDQQQIIDELELKVKDTIESSSDFEENTKASDGGVGSSACDFEDTKMPSPSELFKDVPTVRSVDDVDDLPTAKDVEQKMTPCRAVQKQTIEESVEKQKIGSVEKQAIATTTDCAPNSNTPTNTVPSFSTEKSVSATSAKPAKAATSAKSTKDPTKQTIGSVERQTTGSTEKQTTRFAEKQPIATPTPDPVENESNINTPAATAASITRNTKRGSNAKIAVDGRVARHTSGLTPPSATVARRTSGLTPPTDLYKTPHLHPKNPKKRVSSSVASSGVATSSKRSRSGLPPRPTSSSAKRAPSPAKSIPSSTKLASKTDSGPKMRLEVVSADDTNSAYVMIPPEVKPYSIEVPASRVKSWVMSDSRVSFLFWDGKTACFPFRQREALLLSKEVQIDKSLLDGGKLGQMKHLSARGPCTFSLSAFGEIFVHGTNGDGGTVQVQIQGLQNAEKIAKIHPGDSSSLILEYEDSSLVFVRNGAVKKTIDVGNNKGKRVENVHVGGLMAIIEFVGEDIPVDGVLHCASLDEKCSIPEGPIFLPRGWKAGIVSVGEDHCLIQAVPVPDPKNKKAKELKFRVYSLGSHSHGQLGRGGHPSSPKLVLNLRDESIVALQCAQNVSYTLSESGAVHYFGEFLTQRCNKPTRLGGDMEFHQIAVSDQMFLGARKEDGRLRFEMLEDSDTPCTHTSLEKEQGNVTYVHKLKAAGKHGCAHVGIDSDSSS